MFCEILRVEWAYPEVRTTSNEFSRAKIRFQDIIRFHSSGCHVTTPGPNRLVDSSFETRFHALSNGI